MFKAAIKEKLNILHTTANPRSEKYDNTLFANSKLLVGGWMRKMVTGASPIQAEILDLLKVILCCEIHEGWGLTETAAPSTITDVRDPFSGHVGGPLANVEFKLVDIPEMNYLHTNKPNP